MTGRLLVAVVGCALDDPVDEPPETTVELDARLEVTPGREVELGSVLELPLGMLEVAVDPVNEDEE